MAMAITCAALHGCWASIVFLELRVPSYQAPFPPQSQARAQTGNIRSEKTRTAFQLYNMNKSRFSAAPITASQHPFICARQKPEGHLTQPLVPCVSNLPPTGLGFPHVHFYHPGSGCHSQHVGPSRRSKPELRLKCQRMADWHSNLTASTA